MILLLICALFRCAAAAGVEHRFCSDEGTGADFAPDRIFFLVESETAGNVETVTVRIRNDRHTPFQPVRAGVKLGIDTYMDRYPQWNDKFFPTLMMCEPRHFYGYLQSPSGKMKGVFCSSGVASWSLDYNLGYQDPAPYWFMGHRVEALNIDLLAALPLPSHHPQNLWQLQPGEERTWVIKIVDIAKLDDFEAVAAHFTHAPVLRMERTSCSVGEDFSFVIYGDSPSVTINGNVAKLRKTGDCKWVCLTSFHYSGIYEIVAVDNDRESHGMVNVRYPWRKTIELARDGALRHSQKATSHVESWYGFHSAFIAAKYFPSDSIDRALDRRFDMVFDNLFYPDGSPKAYAWRIQNTASMIGMLVDRFEAYGNKADIDRASSLADWMIGFSQKENGAYMNGKTVYSSVIYPAKSILELADAERDAGREENARRHEASARRAIDQLVASQGDFNTEGEITYEDGMVSCSALQIGLQALRSSKSKERECYAEAMLDILRGHDCLTQLRVPDGRRRGGTMRYWEAQYDVHMLPNMISSPHGWSAWRGYATYYAYLLTGEERWLRETFDAASSLASLIDHETGKLRWAFVVDPQLKVRQICEPDSAHNPDSTSYGTPHPDMYSNLKFNIGEQYVDMISGWQTIVSSDNDVHEAFKFIAEAVLTNAFVIERPDGTFSCYNCKAMCKGSRLEVTPLESQIANLYVNLKNKYKIKFSGRIIEL